MGLLRVVPPDRAYASGHPKFWAVDRRLRLTSINTSGMSRAGIPQGPFRSRGACGTLRPRIGIDPTGQGQTQDGPQADRRRLSVTPQLEPGDMATLAERGVTTVICNRPDAENPPHLQAAAMQAGGRGGGARLRLQPGHRRHADRGQCRGTGRGHRRIRGARRGLLRLRQPLHHRLGTRCGGRGARRRDHRPRREERLQPAWLRPQLEALAAQRGG
jgi:hypothetical protein